MSWDSAIWDAGQWDYARWSVTGERYRAIKNRIERLTTPEKITFGGSPTILFDGSPDIRFGIWTQGYKQLKKRVERLSSTRLPYVEIKKRIERMKK